MEEINPSSRAKRQDTSRAENPPSFPALAARLEAKTLHKRWMTMNHILKGKGWRQGIPGKLFLPQKLLPTKMALNREFLLRGEFSSHYSE